MNAALYEWIVYCIQVLILTPKFVSQHVESAQPPEHVTHKVTNEELERIVEQAGERANQSRIGKTYSYERATALNKFSPLQQCRARSHSKERQPSSISVEKGSRVVSFPPDTTIMPSDGEKNRKKTEMNAERSDDQTTEGRNVGVKENESRSRPRLKLPPPISEDHESDNNVKKGETMKWTLSPKCRRHSKLYGGARNLLSADYLEDSKFEGGPELVIYRGELMSPRRKVKKTETRFRRSGSCPPRLMEQSRAQFSPAETLEAIRDILALPLLARESRIRKQSNANPFDCTDHFPNKTTCWGEVMPIDLNALSKVVPEMDEMSCSILEPSKLYVVLDVDECLIHSNFCTVGAGKHYRQAEARPDKVSQVNTIFVDTEDGEAILVNQRPGLMHFLEAVAAEFHVVAFTAGKECYASQVLDAIDPHNRIFTQRLFRQHCHAAKGGIFVKDLRCVQGLDLSRAVLVDNSPLSFIYQPNNGILVSSWFDDIEDTALNSVLQLLHYLASEDDVRTVLQDLFGLGTILKSYRAYVGCDNMRNLNGVKGLEDWPDVDSIEDQGVGSGGTVASTSTLRFFDNMGSLMSSPCDADSNTVEEDYPDDIDDVPLGDTLTLVSHSSLPY